MLGDVGLDDVVIDEADQHFHSTDEALGRG